MADRLEERINIKRISIGKPVFLFYFYGRIEDILSSDHIYLSFLLKAGELIL